MRAAKAKDASNRPEVLGGGAAETGDEEMGVTGCGVGPDVEFRSLWVLGSQPRFSEPRIRRQEV